jgi:hypothetical protein
MQRTVKVSDDQVVLADDINNIGAFARASVDSLVADTINNGLGYAGFQAVASTSTQVTVGAGRFYKAGEIYSNDDQGGVVLDMLPRLPAVNQRIVSIIAWGVTQDTDIEPRSFLIDAATDQLEARATATESRRRANIGIVVGTESPTPIAPSIPADQIEVARVLLSTTGVVSVTMVAANRVPSVKGNAEDIAVLKDFDDRTGRRIETIASDVAVLAQKYDLVPSPFIMRQVFRDLARIRRLSRAPSTAVAYFEDYFLDSTGSDTTNGAWLASVLEGVRFPAAQQRLDTLQLLNPLDSRVLTTNNIMLPAWTEMSRIEVLGSDVEIALNSFQVQTITQVARQVSHSALRTGPEFTICENAAQWVGGNRNAQSGQLLTRQGETLQVLGLSDNPWNMTDTAQNGHLNLRVAQTWTDTWTETYWDQVTNTETFLGATLAQTFLNSQAGYLTSLGLFFRRIGPSGDVRVSICEEYEGAPSFRRVIATVTVPRANLVAGGETKVNFAPTYLKPGLRYAFIVNTGGDHTLNGVVNNKYANGTLFRSTDQAWVQGDLYQDLAFRAYFAKFDTPRVEVQFTPLQLENGMAGLRFIRADIVPDGCSMIHEVQVNGVWMSLTRPYEVGAHPFQGLPALLPFRIVFQGTVDIMPGVDMSRTERLTTRPRTDFTWISATRDAGQTVNTVTLEVTVDAFDVAFHTVTASLLKGAGFSTVQAPFTTSVAVDATRSDRRVITYTFTSVAAQQFKFRIQGTTTTANRVFHVERRVDFAVP